MNDSLDRLPRYFYSYRNKVYYGAKRNFIGHVKSNTRITLEAIRLIFAPNVDNRLKRLSVLIKGVKAGLVFRLEIEYVEK